MANDIEVIAKISHIDRILDDFKEEMGDLPELIKEKEDDVKSARNNVLETEQILNDIREFVKTAKITLVNIKEKEDKLTQQQFLVRNNKEFDAISAEIANLKDEHEKLFAKMRTEGIKEENLMSILEQQKQHHLAMQNELEELSEQHQELAETQHDDIDKFNKIRKMLKLKIDEVLFERYSRIRTRIPDAAVAVKKSSCTGCFRSIPQQIIVEMRNQPERIFQCENCGRLLIPEWVEVNEEELEK